MLSQVSVLLPENWPWHCINNHWNLSHLIISSKYNNINKNSNLRKGTKKILLPRNVISGCSTFCILFSFDHPSSQILKNFCNKQKFLQLIKVMHKQQEDTLSKTNKYDFIFCVKIIYALNFIVNFIKKWSNTHTFIHIRIFNANNVSNMPKYRPFHKTSPISSAFVNRISVMNYQRSRGLRIHVA